MKVTKEDVTEALYRLIKYVDNIDEETFDQVTNGRLLNSVIMCRDWSLESKEPDFRRSFKRLEVRIS